MLRARSIRVALSQACSLAGKPLIKSLLDYLSDQVFQSRVKSEILSLLNAYASFSPRQAWTARQPLVYEKGMKRKQMPNISEIAFRRAQIRYSIELNIDNNVPLMRLVHGPLHTQLVSHGSLVD